jgi:hypothetical protein
MNDFNRLDGSGLVSLVGKPFSINHQNEKPKTFAIDIETIIYTVV